MNAMSYPGLMCRPARLQPRGKRPRADPSPTQRGLGGAVEMFGGKHEQRRNEARLVFNKIIAGHYRDAANDYSQVGALFVTWAVNDLQLSGDNSEVSSFR